MISLKDNLKNKLKITNDSRDELNKKKKILIDLEENVISCENLYEEIIERIRSNNEKEDILKDGENKNTENKIKTRIKELKVKNLQFFI